MAFSDRIKHAWNAFQSKDPPKEEPSYGYGVGMFGQSGNSSYLTGVTINKSDLIKAIISRIALDASMVDLKHLKIDSDGNQSSVDSGLINCMTTEANVDQSGRQLMYDIYWSMLDEGVIAVVPVDTTTKPLSQGGYDINTMRVGKIVQWYPSSVRVRLYNEKNGQVQEVSVDKNMCAIIESPFYAVLKQDNQTLKLLQSKIRTMQSVDNRIAAGQIDAFIQLPYTTKSDSRKKYAEKRTQEIEEQLKNGTHGLGYLDATEKVIQLNRPVTDQSMNDITRLQQDFYNQLGVTENILNGTANEAQMLNYYTRTIDPVVTAVLEEFTRKFLTKTARTQGQILKYYRDPFKMTPVESLATLADTFSRNAIMTPNELRELVGKEPNPSPLADQLYNRNIADANQAGGINTAGQATLVSNPTDPTANDMNSTGGT